MDEILSLEYNYVLLKVPFPLNVRQRKEGRLTQFSVALHAPFRITNLESALRHIGGLSAPEITE